MISHDHEPSEQQAAVFAAIAEASSNVLVDAKAGSGKTWTIVEGMKYIPAGEALTSPDVVFLAFNKNIADTLKSRCPRHVACSTFHSRGRRALVDSGLVPRNVELNNNKARRLVWNAMDREDPDVRSVVRLIDVAKGEWPVDLNSVVWWSDLIKRQDLQFEQPKRAVEVARSVIEKTLQNFDVIDFSDMLFMPIFHNLSFDPMDWIFVDEAQDLNGVQHEIVARLFRQASEASMDWGGDRKAHEPQSSVSASVGAVAITVPSTRCVAVGDPHQAIYAFRGAHSDSMERLRERFAMRTYPLSVSYRCPRQVVLEAQKYLCR